MGVAIRFVRFDRKDGFGCPLFSVFPNDVLVNMDDRFHAFLLFPSALCGLKDQYGSDDHSDATRELHEDGLHSSFPDPRIKMLNTPNVQMTASIK